MTVMQFLYPQSFEDLIFFGPLNVYDEEIDQTVPERLMNSELDDNLEVELDLVRYSFVKLGDQVVCKVIDER